MSDGLICTCQACCRRRENGLQKEVNMVGWISIKEKLPEKTGRYLVLMSFEDPVICNEKKVRKNIPFVTNYRFPRGWMIETSDGKVTHWREIPDLPQEEEEHK